AELGVVVARSAADAPQPVEVGALARSRRIEAEAMLDLDVADVARVVGGEPDEGGRARGARARVGVDVGRGARAGRRHAQPAERTTERRIARVVNVAAVAIRATVEETEVVASPAIGERDPRDEQRCRDGHRNCAEARHSGERAGPSAGGHGATSRSCSPAGARNALRWVWYLA